MSLNHPLPLDKGMIYFLLNKAYYLHCIFLEVLDNLLELNIHIRSAIIKRLLFIKCLIYSIIEIFIT